MACPALDPLTTALSYDLPSRQENNKTESVIEHRKGAAKRGASERRSAASSNRRYQQRMAAAAVGNANMRNRPKYYFDRPSTVLNRQIQSVPQRLQPFRVCAFAHHHRIAEQRKQNAPNKWRHAREEGKRKGREAKARTSLSDVVFAKFSQKVQNREI